MVWWSLFSALSLILGLGLRSKYGARIGLAWSREGSSLLLLLLRYYLQYIFFLCYRMRGAFTDSSLLAIELLSNLYILFHTLALLRGHSSRSVSKAYF